MMHGCRLALAAGALAAILLQSGAGHAEPARVPRLTRTGKTLPVMHPRRTAGGWSSTASTSPPRAAGGAPTCAVDATVNVGVFEGTTIGAGDRFGGVVCGTRGGGTGAPDRLFEFVAPAPGVYDLTVEGHGLAPLLSVRRGDCRGTFVGCAVDKGGGNRVRLSVELDSGDRAAIVVDGNGAGRQGAFTLGIDHRRPDLTVRIVAAPATGHARGRVGVTAEVENTGAADAGPFALEIGLATDPQLAALVGGESTGCAYDGLASGGSVLCSPFNDLVVPDLSPGTYFLGARVDPLNAVAELDEGNNADAREFRLPGGIVLASRGFRAASNAVYYVIQARVPEQNLNGAEEVVLTSFGFGFAFNNACFNLPELSFRQQFEAIAGIRDTYLVQGIILREKILNIKPLSELRRTGILRVDDVDDLHFNPSGGGRLTLGSGPRALTLCEGTPGCTTSAVARLRPMTEESGGVPRACLAESVRFTPTCDEPLAFPPKTLSHYAFDVGSRTPWDGQDTCDPELILTRAFSCQRRPTDGVTLAPGEVVVVYHDGVCPPDEGEFCDAIKAAFAGFSIDLDGINPRGCPAGSIVDAVVNLHDSFPNQ